MSLELDQLVPSPSNIRTDMGDIEGLELSIRAHGVLQPLLVAADGDKFRVVVGHRRLEAARRAGVTKVPCIERVGFDDVKILEVMLVENVQRKDLNPVEEAHAIQALANRLGCAPQDCYKRIGKSVDHIWRRMLMLELSPEEQEQVIAGTLRIGEAERRAKLYRAGRDDGHRPGRRASKEILATSSRYFSYTHPLSSRALALCAALKHPRQGSVVACGPCWEETIRTDERIYELDKCSTCPHYADEHNGPEPSFSCSNVGCDCAAFTPTLARRIADRVPAEPLREAAP